MLQGAQRSITAAPRSAVSTAGGPPWKALLDIGAWDGWFSFEMERRGAQATAVDCIEQPGFLLAKERLASQVDYRVFDVYDLSAGNVGQFDIVLFLGVLYHLKHPLLGLEKVCALTKSWSMVVCDLTDRDSGGWPAGARHGVLRNGALAANRQVVRAKPLLWRVPTRDRARRVKGDRHSRPLVLPAGRRQPAIPTAEQAARRSTSEPETNSQDPPRNTFDLVQDAECSRPRYIFPWWADTPSSRLRAPHGSDGGRRTVVPLVSPALARMPSAPPQRLQRPVGRRDEESSRLGQASQIEIVAWRLGAHQARLSSDCCVSIWFSGMPRNAEREDIRVELDDTELEVTFLSSPDENGRRQINARVPINMAPSEYALAASCAGVTCSPAKLKLLPAETARGAGNR